MMLYRIVLALALGAAGISTPAHATDDEVIVDARQFQCLVRRIETVPREPLGIYVGIKNCARRGPTILRAFVAPPAPSPDGLDTILLVTPERLACVRRFRRNIAAIVEPLPQARYRLRWDPCPAR